MGLDSRIHEFIVLVKIMGVRCSLKFMWEYMENMRLEVPSIEYKRLRGYTKSRIQQLDLV